MRKCVYFILLISIYTCINQNSSINIKLTLLTLSIH